MEWRAVNYAEERTMEWETVNYAEAPTGQVDATRIFQFYLLPPTREMCYTFAVNRPATPKGTLE